VARGLSIPDLDAGVFAFLKRLATRHGQSTDVQTRSILNQVLRGEAEGCLVKLAPNPSRQITDKPRISAQAALCDGKPER
jgi:plasmid stability protein